MFKFKPLEYVTIHHLTLNCEGRVIRCIHEAGPRKTPDYFMFDGKKFHSCERKIRYASKGEARKYLSVMKKKGLSNNFGAYECPYCEGFHLGHRKDGRKATSSRPAPEHDA